MKHRYRRVENQERLGPRHSDQSLSFKSNSSLFNHYNRTRCCSRQGITILDNAICCTICFDGCCNNSPPRCNSNIQRREFNGVRFNPTAVQNSRSNTPGNNSSRRTLDGRATRFISSGRQRLLEKNQVGDFNANENDREEDGQANRCLHACNTCTLARIASFEKGVCFTDEHRIERPSAQIRFDPASLKKGTKINPRS